MSLKLFSGTSNPQLSEEVAQATSTSLAKVEVIRFKNSEVRVRIEEDVKHDTCVVMKQQKVFLVYLLKIFQHYQCLQKKLNHIYKTKVEK